MVRQRFLRRSVPYSPGAAVRGAHYRHAPSVSRPPPSACRAFTLLELVVALAVFAVLAVLAYGGLRSVLDAREQTAAGAGRLADLQMAVSLLSQDLQQSAPRTVRGAYGETAGALVGGLHGVELTRAGHANPTGARRATLQRLRWGLEAGDLVRWTWPVLDRTPASLPAERRVLDGVESLRLRYHLDGRWHDSWPPAGRADLPADRLPAAVEFSIELSDWGRVTRVALLTGETWPGGGP